MRRMLVELDMLLSSKQFRKAVHLIAKMQDIVHWHRFADGSRFAVDSASGEVLLKVSSAGGTYYAADDLLPLTVLYENYV